jgi:hypothetical protein
MNLVAVEFLETKSGNKYLFSIPMINSTIENYIQQNKN